MNAASAQTEARRQQEGQFAVFSVAGERLALPVDAVRRFLPLPRLDWLPTAPMPVEGVFRYRGEVVAVLRLAALLGLPVREIGLYAPLLLMAPPAGRPDRRTIALLAGRVEAIATVAPQDLLPADPTLTFNGCAVAAFAWSGSTVTVLAPDRLLTGTEGRLLDAFQETEARRLEQWGGQGRGGPACP